MPEYWKYRMAHNFYPALRGFRRKPTIYLEIGVLEGRTAQWMLENILIHKDSFMIGIDPVVVPLKAITEKYGEKVQIIQGLSQDIIPKKVKANKWKPNSIDIVYIDGDHSPEAITNDFNMCWPLLKENGILIFDDYLIRDNKTGRSRVDIKEAIDKIISDYKDTMKVVFINRQVGIKKINNLRKES